LIAEAEGLLSKVGEVLEGRPEEGARGFRARRGEGVREAQITEALLKGGSASTTRTG